MPVNINHYWLNDAQLASIANSHPSSPFGVELMRQWPARYPMPLLTSDTYRGCAIVLHALWRELSGRFVSIWEIQKKIEELDCSLKTSSLFAPGSDLLGGASLTVTNAWNATKSGVTSAQVVASYESELIYVARLFVSARQAELAGHVLV